MAEIEVSRNADISSSINQYWQNMAMPSGSTTATIATVQVDVALEGFAVPGKVSLEQRLCNNHVVAAVYTVRTIISINRERRTRKEHVGL